MEIVKLITKKLNEENIKYELLISNPSRTDGIAITVIDFKEAIKVSKIINNSLIIKNNSNKLNPFMVQSGIVNICQDFDLKYNNELSKILADYINDIVKKDILPSLDGLIDYINQNALLSKDVEFHSADIEIVRSKLKKFILLSLNTDNLSVLEENYNVSLNEKNSDEDKIYSENKYTIEEIKMYLQEHISVTEKKHGKNHLLMAIKDYLNTGYCNGFSRIMIDGKLSRDIFKYRITVIRMLQDMYNLRVNKKDYVKDQDDYIKLNILYDAIIKTYNKYKEETSCIMILREFIQNSNYFVFTSKSIDGKNTRKKIEEIGQEEYINIFKRRYKTDNILEAIDKFVEEFNLNKKIKNVR